MKYNWPEVANEDNLLCDKMWIEDVKQSCLDKKEYKKILNKVSITKHKELIKENMKQMKI